MHTLEKFRVAINREIERYLDKAIQETAKRDRLSADALRYVKKVTMAGGKRLRGAFMYYGYLAAGGHDNKRILKTAVSIELIHAFLLIHDDVIDRDGKRHGLNSVNRHFALLAKKIFAQRDSVHFGNSMAIVIGDMVGALGNQIIFGSGFPDRAVMEALHKLQSIISLTAIGEASDIFLEYNGRATEDEVLAMYENKTARYTMEGPLHLGAILGGANGALLGALTQYALPIGVAFQMRDDILGVFGSERKLGKEIGSDIREGKQTLLVVKASAQSNATQRKQLKAILGKPNLTSSEVGEFQDIIRATGALAAVEKHIEKLVAQGRRAVVKQPIPSEAQCFFQEVADYMLIREV